MKIEIKNFGPISKLEFDLSKNITMIYGKNQTGKSYAVTIVYILIKAIQEEFGLHASRKLHWGSWQFLEKECRNFVDRLQIGEKKSLSEFIIQRTQLDFTELLNEPIKKSLRNSFKSLFDRDRTKRKKNFTISIANDKDLTLTIGMNKLGELDILVSGMKLDMCIELIEQDGLRYRFTDTDDNGFVLESKTEFVDTLFTRVGDKIDRAIKSFIVPFNQFFCLPANRYGIWTATKSFIPLIAKISSEIYRDSGRTIDLPSFTTLESDYIAVLSKLHRNNSGETLISLAEKLESELLNGTIKYSEEENNIYFSPKDNNLELSLSESSSMVAELSSLVLYFRYLVKNRAYESIFRAEKGSRDILIIEEPEAHLHPEAQVKLMDILAELPQYGVSIIITSHSNYMFHKLNNLLLSGKVTPEQTAVYHLVMGKSGSVVNKKMKAESSGIEDENFLSVVEDLFDEQEILIEKYNDSQNKKS